MQDRRNKHRTNEGGTEMKGSGYESGISSWKKDGRVYVQLGIGVCLEYNIRDDVEMGYGMVQLYRAGVGSSRDIGEIFGRSGVDVIRKTKLAKEGIENLRDGRRNNGRKEKLNKGLKAKILVRISKEPTVTDAELTELINKELPKGQEVATRTVKRYLSDSGVGIWRSALRGEESKSAGKKCRVESALSKYSGVFLSMRYLEELGFWEAIGKLKSGTRDKYSIEEVSLSIYFLYVLGKKRLSELDNLFHKDFSCLMGREKRHLLSSGAHKRLSDIAGGTDIEEFEDNYSEGIFKWGEIESEIIYADTHVSEVWRKENITMALHGIKRRKVKAINKHYLVDNSGKVPLARELSEGKRRLSQSLPDLIKKIKKHCLRFTISFDKGGVSKKVLNTCIEEKVGFVAWGPKWRNIKREIEKIPLKSFKLERKEEKRNISGKIVKKIKERLCETKINYNGVGELRAVVVYFNNTGEMAWIYTNLTKKECSTLEIREIIRYKQRVENYFKQRKCFGAMDCFGGGPAKRKKIIKPELKQLIRRERRLEHQIVQTKEALQQINLNYSSQLLPEWPFRKARSLFKERLSNLEEKLKKAEQLRVWIEGGEKPDWVMTPYELDLRKEKILTQFQDWAYTIKWKIIKEFQNCYADVLRQQGVRGEELKTKLDNFDKTNVWKEIISLEGQLNWDHKNKLLEVSLAKLRKPLLQKALQKYCYKLNQQKSGVHLGKTLSYKLLIRCE